MIIWYRILEVDPTPTADLKVSAALRANVDPIAKLCGRLLVRSYVVVFSRMLSVVVSLVCLKDCHLLPKIVKPVLLSVLSSLCCCCRLSGEWRSKTV
jgi:hypothetical protein